MQTKKSPEDNLLAEQIRSLISAIEMTSIAVLPRTSEELLQSIVEAAARIFGAAAASILLLDEQQQELVFKVAHNAGDANVIGLRTPMDKGIAGYVVMTGQPIAVSNVEEDSRFNRSFAEKTGYVPKSILAMPLLSEGKVIGVMEVLDKISASSFGMQDMELLGLFARQAAIAINQAQQIDNLGEAMIKGLKALAESSDLPNSDELVQTFEQIEIDLSQDLIDLVNLFNEISSLGSAEQKLCIQVLQAFRSYRRSKFRTRPTF
jgi:GAF domain-containing protein